MPCFIIFGGIVLQINYDLLKRCDHISKGLVSCPELLLTTQSKSKSDIPKAVLVASNTERRKSKSRSPSPQRKS